MTRARQITNALLNPQDMGVVQLCERLACYVSESESHASYAARQVAVWDKMDAGIARVRATNDAAVIETKDLK